GRRRNSRLWFEENINVNPEAVRKIWPRIVIGGDMLTLKFLHDRAPSLQFRVDRCFELLVVRVVKSRISGIDRGERLRNMLRDRFGDNRIDREMRIAERVNIAG